MFLSDLFSTGSPPMTSIFPLRRVIGRCFEVLTPGVFWSLFCRPDEEHSSFESDNGVKCLHHQQDLDVFEIIFIPHLNLNVQFIIQSLRLPHPSPTTVFNSDNNTYWCYLLALVKIPSTTVKYDFITRKRCHFYSTYLLVTSYLYLLYLMSN